MIALYYIHILACFSSVFVSSEDQGSYYEIGGDIKPYPTKSIRVDFPGQSCGQEFVIEGAELNSSLDALHAYDQCVLSFSPVPNNYNYRKLVMKFTHYDITNCNVSVDVYKHRHHNFTRVRPIHSLGCLDTPPPSWHKFDHITVVLRNRYHTVSGYDFRIVITAFSELSKKASCPGFNCENRKCISRSLLCDGVVNCFDELDKDEKWCYANGTYFGGAWDETTYSSRWTLAFYAVVGIPIAIGVIAYYACRRSGSQAVVVQQREQAGLLVATAPSGNVITLQQPIYVPGVNQPSQQPPPTYAGTTYPNI